MLTVSYCNKTAKRWCEAGYVQSFDQFILQEAEPKTETHLGEPLTVTQGVNSAAVSGSNFSVRIAGGQIISLVYDGKEMLHSPVRPNLFRAVTDNDLSNTNFVPFLIPFHPYYAWQRATNGARGNIQSVESKADGSICVTTQWSISGMSNVLSEITVYPVGKKMARAAKKLEDGTVSVATASINTRSTAAGISDFTDGIKDAFLQKLADKVLVLYMHYKTPSRQVMQIDQLLPVSQEAIAAAGGNAGEGKRENDNAPCIFEPDANAIFNAVLPLYINSVMQEVCTENNASEAAARVMAMQTASDNAQKLLEELQLEYNKLRQQSITTELLDILGGQVER